MMQAPRFFFAMTSIMRARRRTGPTFSSQLVCSLLVGITVTACSTDTSLPASSVPADVLLINARVYTFAWPAPATDGTPSAQAPYHDGRWTPDADAIAIRDGRIVFAGAAADAQAYIGPATRKVDINGATVLPGLIDSHTHIFDLGTKLRHVDLTGVTTQAEAIERVVARAAVTPKGQWVKGGGWDEGAWANRYPDKARLSAAVPDHPVMLDSLHGFAVWVNQAALDAGDISADTEVPVGGEMLLGSDGTPSGLFLNRATTMIDAIVPAPDHAEFVDIALAGATQMARDGYVSVHDAGLSTAHMRALEQLESDSRLPIRVFAMLSLRDEDLMRRWIARGPDTDNDSMLVTRTVKAYYDGALGSRGARLLDDYSDRPGHRGVSGDAYGFDQQLNAQAMRAGFQVAIHAIGDAGNREALDILEAEMATTPAARAQRHRIEHAQVLHPDDVPRLAELGVIASMEPPHAVEDKTWAEDRLGPQRVLGAYAWRTLREAGARLTFNSDNPGSDHSIFYGLHAAVTRQDKSLQPAGGWYPEQRVTMEEALRGYTSWAAYASFREQDTGTIAAGRWADLTVMDIDPLRLASDDPAALLGGQILMTIVGGDVVYERTP